MPRKNRTCRRKRLQQGGDLPNQNIVKQLETLPALTMEEVNSIFEEIKNEPNSYVGGGGNISRFDALLADLVNEFKLVADTPSRTDRRRMEIELITLNKRRLRLYRQELKAHIVKTGIKTPDGPAIDIIRLYKLVEKALDLLSPK